MWTPTTRAQHKRVRAKYETDLTDAEWAVIAPYLPGVVAGSTARLDDARDRGRNLLRHAGELPVAADPQ
jgi:transposase